MLAKIARNARKLLLLFGYTGRGKQCSVCGKRSAHFARFGVPPRPSARCPRCNSLERHRFLWEYLSGPRGLQSLPSGARLLHFAPEPFLSSLLEEVPGIDYVTVDLEVGAADFAADITSLPFRQGAFDAIICSHVLEHVHDDHAAILELRRTMGDNGWGLVMVPLRKGSTIEDPSVVDPGERTRLFGQSDHVRWYGDDFVARLREGGFQVETIVPGNLPAATERMFRISRDHARAPA